MKNFIKVQLPNKLITEMFQEQPPNGNTSKL